MRALGYLVKAGQRGGFAFFDGGFNGPLGRFEQQPGALPLLVTRLDRLPNFGLRRTAARLMEWVPRTHDTKGVFALSPGSQSRSLSLIALYGTCVAQLKYRGQAVTR